MALLDVKDLSVYYGVIQALKGISFHVDKGEIVALIGSNGAGKTTTLHTLSGLLKPQSGTIMIRISRSSRGLRQYQWEWLRCPKDGVSLRT